MLFTYMSSDVMKSDCWFVGLLVCLFTFLRLDENCVDWDDWIVSHVWREMAARILWGTCHSKLSRRPASGPPIADIFGHLEKQQNACARHTPIFLLFSFLPFLPFLPFLFFSFYFSIFLFSFFTLLLFLLDPDESGNEM